MTEENFHRSSITFWLCVSVWSRKLAYCSNGWHRGTEGASQYVNGRNAALKENFRRERWIEVDMAWQSISMK